MTHQQEFRGQVVVQSSDAAARRKGREFLAHDADVQASAPTAEAGRRPPDAEGDETLRCRSQLAAARVVACIFDALLRAVPDCLYVAVMLLLGNQACLQGTFYGWNALGLHAPTQIAAAIRLRQAGVGTNEVRRVLTDRVPVGVQPATAVVALRKFVPHHDLGRVANEGTRQLQTQADLRLIQVIVKLFVKPTGRTQCRDRECRIGSGVVAQPTVLADSVSVEEGLCLCKPIHTVVLSLEFQSPGVVCRPAQAGRGQGARVVLVQDLFDPVVERQRVVVNEGNDIAVGLLDAQVA